MNEELDTVLNMDQDLAAILELDKEEEAKDKDNKDKSKKKKDSKKEFKVPKGTAFIVDASEADLIAAEDAARSFEEKIAKNNLWATGNNNNDRKYELALQAAGQMRSTKTGQYARIPIFCKEDKCPFAESCVLLMNGLTVKGQPCPHEIAQIRQKYMQYAEELGLDENPDTKYVDDALLEEVITMEIYMDRCKALMSKEISPVQMIVVGVSDDGNEIRTPEVSKASDAYERFAKRRNEAFAQLMATRRDKAKLDKGQREIKTIQDVLDSLDATNDDNDIFTIEERPDNADELIESGKLKKK
jgi:hypothetical protein